MFVYVGHLFGNVFIFITMDRKSLPFIMGLRYDDALYMKCGEGRMKFIVCCVSGSTDKNILRTGWIQGTSLYVQRMHSVSELYYVLCWDRIS